MMHCAKRYGIFFCVLVFTTVKCLASKNQEAFLCANDFYEQGKFADAFTKYQEIDQKGSAVWYNMGNCAYHCGDLAEACVYWLRAQPDASVKKVLDTMHNISIVTKQDEHSFWSVLQTSFWALVYTSSFVVLQFLFLFLWFVLYLVVRRTSSAVRSMLVWFLFFLVLCSGALLLYKHNMQRSGKAVTDKTENTLFTGPNSKYHTVGTISGIRVVKVLSTRPGWCKIHSDNTTGWVSQEVLKTV